MNIFDEKCLVHSFFKNKVLKWALIGFMNWSARARKYLDYFNSLQVLAH